MPAERTEVTSRLNTCSAVAILIHIVAAPLLPAAVQVDLAVGGDGFLRSKYVWRGITRNDGWVFQPNAYLSVLYANG